MEKHAPVDTKPGPEGYKKYHNHTNEKWTQDPGLRKLNMGIGFMFASAAANGYDGSLMNGLLTIQQCK